MATCPLCASADLLWFAEDKKRHYLQCQQCQLVSVPQQFHLSPAAEKAEYDLHNNQFADAGYVNFLNRCWQPLLSALTATTSPSAKPLTTLIGLDFGCGEGQVLSQMAAQAGVKMNNYDLYYHPDQQVLKQRYDFITMTEVIEHLAQPTPVLDQLNELLVTGGVLAVMTKRVRDQQAFAGWHYKNDQTHLCFYSDATFAWLASHYGWHCDYATTDVVLLTKR